MIIKSNDDIIIYNHDLRYELSIKVFNSNVYTYLIYYCILYIFYTKRFKHLY